MYCNACAAPNPADARFCSACAAPLTARVPTLSERETERHESLSDAPTQRDPGKAAPAAPGGPPGIEGFVGTTVSGYQIVKKLGEGGMGAVFLATQIKLHRPVAIKVLPPQFSRDRQLLERFEREARAVAVLDSPYIVPVHDMFETSGLYCIAMGLADGGSVRDLKRGRRRLPEHEAAELIRQAALGLWAAAEKGIVHRDIKPDNLLLTAEGRVKIADFGLAKALDTASNLTRSGAVMGTPHYMSPEQCRDTSGADHRSDLYSLGCTLFELLVGRPPFQAPSAMNLMLQHTTEPAPRVRSLRAEVSAPMDALVARLLEKDPDARFQTGAALAAALAPLCEAPQPAEEAPAQPPPLPATPGEAHKLPRALGYAAALVLAALGAFGIGYLIVQSNSGNTESGLGRVLPADTAAVVVEAVGEEAPDLEAPDVFGAEWIRPEAEAHPELIAALLERPLEPNEVEMFFGWFKPVLAWRERHPGAWPQDLGPSARFRPFFELGLWQDTGIHPSAYLALLLRLSYLRMAFDDDALRQSQRKELQRLEILLARQAISRAEAEPQMERLKILEEVLASVPGVSLRVFERYAPELIEVLEVLNAAP